MYFQFSFEMWSIFNVKTSLRNSSMWKPSILFRNNSIQKQFYSETILFRNNSIQKQFYSENIKHQSIQEHQETIETLKTITENSQDACNYNLWNMSSHLNCKIDLVLTVHSLVQKNRIKSVLLHLLSFISTLNFCMRYLSLAPWLASALSLINSITLGYLAYCQNANVTYLNRALVNLCQQLPFPDPEQDLNQD